MSTESTGNRLEGKVALISGGARGMGASHARAMVAEGARVVIGDILDEEGNALADELGDAAVYVHLDVTDRAQWADAVATTVKRFGSLNVLVNNAGIANFAPIGEYTGEQWDTLIGINLTGVFNGMTASVDALKAGAPSSIINISSTAGLQGFASLPGYSAAKHGLVGLSKSAALDLGADNVRVNTVHPGVIATPMTDGMETPQTHVAMKRVGQPEEVSAMIVFLASDESSFSTGAEFVADGGETAGLAPSE
ncbi:3-alpha-(or 20-beta)-hydroxysteroid dehydrogenase [Euzebya pacifica]|uniref:3-alpha-(Or 20-beta)-hydroxysteroid dehydrogenase n=1 Tax=Euzebya pacifica TaxID=1608957 RepID=A0A346XS07_9ACTN|nr:SDR family oxidoreductase [Euzebya pacifica]AXV05004.1 3-alpha-(or 20-beta)-hydroxysteroid dehydrogenase [Euzebya pacifica]